MQAQQLFQPVCKDEKTSCGMTKNEWQRFIINMTGFTIAKSQFMVKGKRDVS